VKIPALHVRFAAARGESDRELASAALLDCETATVHELSDTEWRVCFRTPDERDRAAAALCAYGDATAVDLEIEDWARRSQESLRAVTVGRLVVAPPWDVPADSDAPVIVIEPSMGFGTAHHATTRLCLRALQRLDLHGSRVLDIGTGSGVLAIAAAKLGAGSVVGIDDDPDALQAALDNVARNRVNVDLRGLDLRRDRLEPADVVLANLTGSMLARSAAGLAALARGGTVIVSGLLDNEADAVRAAFSPFTSRFHREDEDGWVSFTCTIP
jgi:ribosomal protein L11 methyltransferase